MKLTFWQGEFEFDRDDAVIVIPLILLLLSFATPLPKVWVLVGFAVYYVVLFFLRDPLKKLYSWLYNKWAFRCPDCCSSHTVELGLAEYLGDVSHYWFRCNDCGDESVCLLSPRKLVKPGNWKLTSGK
jgi:hypothetical protein